LTSGVPDETARTMEDLPTLGAVMIVMVCDNDDDGDDDDK